MIYIIKKNGRVVSSGQLFENRIDVEGWLNSKQAADYLKISTNALRMMVHRGAISSYHFGRRLRFKLEDCQALIKRKGV